ncbi:hypothetical protein T484DRAFT_1758374 [Baffinella frigidus]|nr:hypothetical protein T484DRAFT_1758374 [Cryptophyta sp. CCMP2293]
MPENQQGVHDNSNDVDEYLLVGNEAVDSDLSDSDEVQIMVDPTADVTLLTEVPCIFARDSMLGFMTNHVDQVDTRSITFDGAVKLHLRTPSPNAICPISMETVSTSQMHMCVYFTLPDGTVHGMVVNFLNGESAMPVDPTGELRLRVPRAKIRAILRVAIRQNAETVNLIVFARRVGDSANVYLVEVAQSGPLDIPVAEAYRSSMFRQTPSQSRYGVAVRDVVVVQRANLQRQENDARPDSSHHGTFSMGWQVYQQRVMNTLTDMSFNVKFSELAMFIGDMISEH